MPNETRKSAIDLEKELAAMGDGSLEIPSKKDSKKMSVEGAHVKDEKETKKRPQSLFLDFITSHGGKKAVDQCLVNYRALADFLSDHIKMTGLNFIVKTAVNKIDRKNPNFDKTKDEGRDNPKTIKVDIYNVSVVDAKDETSVIFSKNFVSENVLFRCLAGSFYAFRNDYPCPNEKAEEKTDVKSRIRIIANRVKADGKTKIVPVPSATPKKN